MHSDKLIELNNKTKSSVAHTNLGDPFFAPLGDSSANTDNKPHTAI